MLNVILPNQFGDIGDIATFAVFDGFKREHGVKDVSAQAEDADLGVQLTKAKGAAVKNSYLELERSSQLAQLARRGLRDSSGLGELQNRRPRS